jgi:hypothetical protein
MSIVVGVVVVGCTIVAVSITGENRCYGAEAEPCGD